ncbi:hypothetical protein TcWFU_002736 [Taenia crassiceps]|uniref:Uncharacterized protein n=1 Tax=Taenia crassiceps TaxID=6207 RepID=A0ABR4Q646_9CEST
MSPGQQSGHNANDEIILDLRSSRVASLALSSKLQDMEAIHHHLYKHINELFEIIHNCKKQGVPIHECNLTSTDYYERPHRGRPHGPRHGSSTDSTGYRTDQPYILRRHSQPRRRPPYGHNPEMHGFRGPFHPPGGANAPPPFYHPMGYGPTQYHALPPIPSHTSFNYSRWNNTFPPFHGEGNQQPLHMNEAVKNASSTHDWHMAVSLANSTQPDQ